MLSEYLVRADLIKGWSSQGLIWIRTDLKWGSYVIKREKDIFEMYHKGYLDIFAAMVLELIYFRAESLFYYE